MRRAWRPTQAPARRKGEGKCYECGQPGHLKWNLDTGRLNCDPVYQQTNGVSHFFKRPARQARLQPVAASNHQPLAVPAVPGLFSQIVQSSPNPQSSQAQFAAIQASLRVLTESEQKLKQKDEEQSRRIEALEAEVKVLSDVVKAMKEDKRSVVLVAAPPPPPPAPADPPAPSVSPQQIVTASSQSFASPQRSSDPKPKGSTKRKAPDVERQANEADEEAAKRAKGDEKQRSEKPKPIQFNWTPRRIQERVAALTDKMWVFGYERLPTKQRKDKRKALKQIVAKMKASAEAWHGAKDAASRSQAEKEFKAKQKEHEQAVAKLMKDTDSVAAIKEAVAPATPSQILGEFHSASCVANASIVVESGSVESKEQALVVEH
jgi:hypothetical protein